MHGNNCVSSMNYPNNYGPSETCTFTAPVGSVMKVQGFQTERSYDFLTIDGPDNIYSGTDTTGFANKAVESSTFTWSSNEANEEAGWKICFAYPWPFNRTEFDSQTSKQGCAVGTEYFDAICKPVIKIGEECNADLMGIDCEIVNDEQRPVCTKGWAGRWDGFEGSIATSDKTHSFSYSDYFSLDYYRYRTYNDSYSSGKQITEEEVGPAITFGPAVCACSAAGIPILDRTFQ